MALPIRLLALSLICTLISSVQTGSASELTSIHMTVDDQNRMTIEISINESDGLGILDTAATYALINQDMLTDQNSKARTEDISILGLSGLDIFPTAQIGPVTVGDVNLDMIPAAVNDHPQLHGNRSVLPANAFSARVIDFDFTNNRINLYDGKPILPRGSSVSKLRYQEIMGLPFIEVRLNGKRGLALIDTGSEVTYINSAFAKAARTRPRPEKTRLLIGATDNPMGAAIVSVRRLALGRHRMRNFLILSSNPPLFTHLGLEDRPIMVLGMDTLRMFRLQIDREQKYVYLARPRSGSS